MDNEHLSASAFTRQSVVFDDTYASNTIIQYKRARVRNHIDQFLPHNSQILELNAGTGEDAIYFAQEGHQVHATDISSGMLDKLRAKVKNQKLENNISIEQCSFTQLAGLKRKVPYNLIFSNFAGLNCTENLEDVLRSFKPLLADNGLVTLVILPPFCMWEFLLLFKGKFKTAFRRLNSKTGADAHLEGINFKCWYYSPSFIVHTLKDDYELLGVEGLCSIVPPSYLEGFAEKYPKLFTKLKAFEDRHKAQWPWKNIGDYYIITLRKK